MLWFPQLASGTLAQFPARKRAVARTIVNSAGDGTTVKLADAGAGYMEWELGFAGLTDAERNAVESLFASVEGRLTPFGFLDPMGNLLEWSEDLTAAVWYKDAGLQLTGGLPDPLGGWGSTLVVNASGAEQAVRQTLEIPAWFQYSVSVWTRSASPASVRLFAGVAERVCETSAEWRRVELRAKLAGAAELVDFGAGVSAGGTTELFGFQVEGQGGASGYKKTTTRSGVFANAWFADDVLVMTADGPNNSRCQVRIRARN